MPQNTTDTSIDSAKHPSPAAALNSLLMCQKSKLKHKLFCKGANAPQLGESEGVSIKFLSRPKEQ